jgi:hypothetical protein
MRLFLDARFRPFIVCFITIVIIIITNVVIVVYYSLILHLRCNPSVVDCTEAAVFLPL